MENEISKKDLLKETGISYGQLYRWKRENLIPEDWFIKKSSFTGQETYFPREKILERIKTIQQLKDRYPLEDLARMLSPELTGITYRVSRVLSGSIMNPRAAEIFQRKLNKEFCSFWEVCVIYTLGLAREKGILSDTDLERISDSLQEWEKDYHSGAYRLYVVECGGVNSVILGAKEPQVLFDRAFRVVESFDLDQLGTAIKEKINAI
jgi:DNA-binding transcriptional MerR regulator